MTRRNVPVWLVEPQKTTLDVPTSASRTSEQWHAWFIEALGQLSQHGPTSTLIQWSLSSVQAATITERVRTHERSSQTSRGPRPIAYGAVVIWQIPDQGIAELIHAIGKLPDHTCLMLAAGIASPSEAAVLSQLGIRGFVNETNSYHVPLLDKAFTHHRSMATKPLARRAISTR